MLKAAEEQLSLYRTEAGASVDALRATLSQAERTNGELRAQLARAESELSDLSEQVRSANKSKHRAESELATAIQAQAQEVATAIQAQAQEVATAVAVAQATAHAEAQATAHAEAQATAHAEAQATAHAEAQATAAAHSLVLANARNTAKEQALLVAAMHLRAMHGPGVAVFKASFAGPTATLRGEVMGAAVKAWLGNPVVPQVLSFVNVRCYGSIMSELLDKLSPLTVVAFAVMFAAESGNTVATVDKELFVHSNQRKVHEIPITDSSVVCTEPANGTWYVYVPAFLCRNLVNKLQFGDRSGYNEPGNVAPIVLEVSVKAARFLLH